jgi:hypothetical protein
VKFKGIKRVDKSRMWVADLECPKCRLPSTLEVYDSVTERVTDADAERFATERAKYMPCPDGCDDPRQPLTIVIDDGVSLTGGRPPAPGVKVYRGGEEVGDLDLEIEAPDLLAKVQSIRQACRGDVSKPTPSGQIAAALSTEAQYHAMRRATHDARVAANIAATLAQAWRDELARPPRAPRRPGEGEVPAERFGAQDRRVGSERK